MGVKSFTTREKMLLSNYIGQSQLEQYSEYCIIQNAKQ